MWAVAPPCHQLQTDVWRTDGMSGTFQKRKQDRKIISHSGAAFHTGPSGRCADRCRSGRSVLEGGSMTGLDMTGAAWRLWLVGLGANCCWGQTKFPCNSWIYIEWLVHQLWGSVLLARRLTKGELDLEIRLAWEVFLITWATAETLTYITTLRKYYCNTHTHTHKHVLPLSHTSEGCDAFRAHVFTTVNTWVFKNYHTSQNCEQTSIPPSSHCCHKIKCKSMRVRFSYQKLPTVVSCIKHTYI